MTAKRAAIITVGILVLVIVVGIVASTILRRRQMEGLASDLGVISGLAISLVWGFWIVKRAERFRKERDER